MSALAQTPLHAAHFNITIEMSLSALIRRYHIARLPISWSGRTWGSSNLKLRAMGRRYLATLLKLWFERLLILDDVLEDSERKENGDVVASYESCSATGASGSEAVTSRHLRTNHLILRATDTDIGGITP